jgi:hypothetical protein
MDPARDSATIMAAMDRMPPKWRALVHEFGWKVVSGYWAEGYTVAGARRDLEGWQARRQAEWLATQFVTRRDLERAA